MVLKRNAALRKRRRLLIRLLLTVSALCIIAIGVALRVSVFTAPGRSEKTSKLMQPGMFAPDIQLMSVHGDVFHLAEHRQQVVVLAFLQTQPDTASTASRSQAVSLTSIEQQYAPKGVHVVFIDASMLETGQQVAHNDLLNVTYDWNIGSIPLLEDIDGSTASRYGVRQTPTLFIVGPSGHVEQAWQGLTSTVQIAFALQRLSGSSSMVALPRTYKKREL